MLLPDGFSILQKGKIPAIRRGTGLENQPSRRHFFTDPRDVTQLFQHHTGIFKRLPVAVNHNKIFRRRIAQKVNRKRSCHVIDCGTDVEFFAGSVPDDHPFRRFSRRHPVKQTTAAKQQNNDHTQCCFFHYVQSLLLRLIHTALQRGQRQRLTRSRGTKDK